MWMFAVRKVLWAAEKYREEQSNPVRWQLIKRAGVGRIASESLIKDTIDTVLATLT